MKNKGLLFFILVPLVLVLFLFVILSLSRSRQTSDTSPESTVPTPIAGDHEHPAVVQDVQVVGVFPQNNRSISYFPVQEVSLTFSTTMNPANINLIINPATETTVRLKVDDDKTIIISPTRAWSPGLTQIKVLRSTKSLNLIQLRQEYIYELYTQFPDNPPPGTDY